MADVTKILDEIKELTLVEVNDLVKALEEEFGVSAAAPVMVAGAAGAADGGAAEQTEFGRNSCRRWIAEDQSYKSCSRDHRFGSCRR